MSKFTVVVLVNNVKRIFVANSCRNATDAADKVMFYLGHTNGGSLERIELVKCVPVSRPSGFDLWEILA